MTAAARPPVAKVPLANQLHEVRRELSQREQEYPRMVAARRINGDAGEVQIKHLRGVLRTLEWLEAHEHLIRSIAQHVEAIKAMPGVLEFMREFPGAQVRRVSKRERF